MLLSLGIIENVELYLALTDTRRNNEGEDLREY